MPIYTLYLSTFGTTPSGNQGVPTDKTNLNNVSWNINFDELFRYENKKYKHCRVRYSLMSASWSAISTDWDTYLGYLTCNLPSPFQGTGSYGTVIGTTSASDCPTTGTTTHCLMLNTTSEAGVDIAVPQNNQAFTLTMNRADLSSGLRISNVYDYQIVLYFELYDPI